MNSFRLTLAPFDPKEIPLGTQLHFRSAENGHVVISAEVHRPGPKGGTFAETELGRVHVADLARVLGAVNALMGGHAG